MSFYNYLKEGPDKFEVSGIVVLTSKNSKKIPAPVLDAVDHIVELEDYTTDQLELIILQRLKYAHIDYQNEYVLKNIVRHGRNDLEKCIRFMRCCVAVMQSQGRQKLMPDDVIKGARLKRLPELDPDIPF